MLAALVVTVGRRAGADIGAGRGQGAPGADRPDRRRRPRHADALERSVDELRDDVGDRQREALETAAAGTRADLVALLSGATEVHGPGREARRRRRQGRRARAAAEPARDQRLLRHRAGCATATCSASSTGCGQSGAEAVAINGQRLTALSAIRAAGDAILVDNKPLVPPYTVLAVGDGQKLSTAFQDSADGQYLHALQENYGIRTSISARTTSGCPPRRA